MQQTLKLLTPLLTPENLALSLEELSANYRSSLDPRLLAAAYHKTYKMTLAASKHFFGLTTDDLASFTLTTLDFCLLNFEPAAAKFTSYYHTILNNKLRHETQALSTHKRKANMFPTSYDGLVENGFEAVADEEYQTWMTMEYVNDCYLTDREKKYCQMVLEDYTNAEIAKELQVSVTMLSHMRREMRQRMDKSVLLFG